RVLDRLPRLTACLGAVEETEVLLPGYVDQDVHAQLVRQTQEPARRQVVGADRVEAGVAHPPEIVADTLRRGELLAVMVGGERPVGDALEAQPPRAVREELAVHAHAAGVALAACCQWHSRSGHSLRCCPPAPAGLRDGPMHP